ncbi:probable maleylacetoacetate isomerase 2 [Anoplophora glabripennis]|uniref:Glutathione S-transferase n=2 Tax=Anoplophora glabripennis TaxID=217634 RepID=A0A8F8QTJ6_ANOGL|nr:probable maleylacetoacetate isomerase 2 [Anoplophora glabripennis]QYA72006.1 glutathione S-transferase [Anoplophora glabripennis]
MAGKAILYSYWRSSCSWRVRIAMNLKEISYDIVPVSILKGKDEQHSDEYRKINPMKQVPSLAIDGNILIESLSILEYLEETRPKIPLLPSDFGARAKVREICAIIASGIQPLQNLKVLNYVGKEKQQEWAQHWINEGFRAVEKILSTTAGEYCIGNDVTLADCFLIPQVYNARRFQVNLELFPNILKIDTRLKNHPAFREADPEHQPDCPNK